MKKIFIYLIAAASILGFTRCDSLDLDPVSSITDANYWKNDAHFATFNNGLYALLRERSYNIFLLGEPRADAFNDAPFGGEAPQGLERFPLNLLNADNVGISNYANMYGIINQLNLMIAKTTETSSLAENEKNYYLGEAYGMRAYLYFHLLRTWGDVILFLDYTSGTTLDLSSLQKAVSPATEIMAQIKSDITASETAFGTNYDFKRGRTYWSLAATKMLKGEAFLWSGSQMGGGTSDYTTAKAALEEVKKADLTLLNDFQSVFAYDNKENKEIIFAIHNGKDEYNMWNDSYRMALVPQQAYMPLYCNAEGTSFADLEEKSLNGLIRLSMKSDLYTKTYREGDTRLATITPVYRKNKDTGKIEYVSCFNCKFKGTMLEGASQRSWLDDYPIYRYADCLLLLAQVKAMLGEDPAAEINQVRERAYGKDYFAANQATLAYPNDNGSFYDDNSFEDPDNSGALKAVLKERFRELLIEGKRWYDLRVSGWEYVKAHSLAEENRLLWPIDANTLTNNKALKQTPGY